MCRSKGLVASEKRKHGNVVVYCQSHKIRKMYSGCVAPRYMIVLLKHPHLSWMEQGAQIGELKVKCAIFGNF